MVVGIGPGNIENITLKALREIKAADVVIGYKTYIELIESIMPHNAEVNESGMGHEIERAELAVKKALEGKNVVVVSSGDPGVYGMAGPVLEVAEKEKADIKIEIVPGVTAATAVAGLLGAPLMTGFALISLSDLLTPWDVIEKRLKAAAKADFVIVLYNPQSRDRTEPIRRAHKILLSHLDPKTPIAIVKQATRKGEKITMTTLDEMLNNELNMTTTIIVGNSSTKTTSKGMLTSRGYCL